MKTLNVFPHSTAVTNIVQMRAASHQVKAAEAQRLQGAHELLRSMQTDNRRLTHPSIRGSAGAYPSYLRARAG